MVGIFPMLGLVQPIISTSSNGINEVANSHYAKTCFGGPKAGFFYLDNSLLTFNGTKKTVSQQLSTYHLWENFTWN